MFDLGFVLGCLFVACIWVAVDFARDALEGVEKDQGDS